jgi:hypothetical protein
VLGALVLSPSANAAAENAATSAATRSLSFIEVSYGWEMGWQNQWPHSSNPHAATMVLPVGFGA